MAFLLAPFTRAAAAAAIGDYCLEAGHGPSARTEVGASGAAEGAAQGALNVPHAAVGAAAVQRDAASKAVLGTAKETGGAAATER